MLYHNIPLSAYNAVFEKVMMQISGIPDALKNVLIKKKTISWLYIYYLCNPTQAS